MSWKVLEKKNVLDSPYVQVDVEVCELPGGKQIDYYILGLADWATVAAFTPKNEIVMVKQYRHPVGKDLLELPAGILESGENPIEGIEREMLEETGFTLNNIEPLGTWHTSSARSEAVASSFFGTVGEEQIEQNLDETEDIEVVLIPAKEAVSMIHSGDICGTTYVCSILAAKERHPELFT